MTIVISSNCGYPYLLRGAFWKNRQLIYTYLMNSYPYEGSHPTRVALNLVQNCFMTLGKVINDNASVMENTQVNFNLLAKIIIDDKTVLGFLLWTR